MKIFPGSDWIRAQVATRYQRFVFTRALRELTQGPFSLLYPASNVLQSLSQGWGNQAWSAGDEYLNAAIYELTRTEGPILECGSGLTTIVLGAMAQEMGREMWALEHIDEWGARVSRVLGDMNIASVHLCVAPLKNYGNFSWYEPPLETMPDNFGLVICDGPPGGVHGGRAGLLPIMRDRLARCSTILIDDTSRKQEETIARQWSHVLDASLEYCGDAKSFAAIRIGV